MSADKMKKNCADDHVPNEDETVLPSLSVTSWSVVPFIIKLLHTVYDSLLCVSFHLFYRRWPAQPIPPITNRLLLNSAAELARKIRHREVACKEVVMAFINRLQEVNGVVNAVVDDRYDEALKEADGIDELLKSNPAFQSPQEVALKKPLLGVPFTSKESTAAKGMRWTFGMICRKGEKATEDAEIMKGVKESGGILIAITNIPELNLWVECRNGVYGQTSNPYDTNRTVGGSSGGEACVVTLCGSPFGLGTDIGGSCRIPAFCCGVYGHKLTAGLINTRGMTYRTGTESLHTIVSAGPITKYASDIRPVALAMLSSCTVSPPNQQLLEFQHSLRTPVNGKCLRYIYIEEPGDPRVSPIGEEMRQAMRHLIQRITDDSRESGCSPPQKIQIDAFRYSYTLWKYWMSKEQDCDFAAAIKNWQGRASLWVELGKKVTGQCDHTMAAIMKLIDTALFPLPDSQWAEHQTNILRSALLEKLGDDGVLLFPSCPSVATYHYWPLFKPFNFAYWCIFNALKLPVTQIPIGLQSPSSSPNPLPLGIQAVAAPYKDSLCIAAAEYIEKLTGGWKAPCSIQIAADKGVTT